MVGGDSGDRPFDAIGETVNHQTADALKLLGNETRLEIIVALWDAMEPTHMTEEDESGLSFSELYDRVGVQDSGQFNYHLDKLIGTFVNHDDDTYSLTGSAFDILSAIIKGAVADPPSFTDEPIDTDCPLCGESVVIDYEDGSLRMRCTDCGGTFRGPDGPPGLILEDGRAPVGLRNRTPQEFFRQGNVSHRHRVMSCLEGVCPNCTGTVTKTVLVCDHHEPGENSLCPQCLKRHRVSWNCVCDICKNQWGVVGWAPIFIETAVRWFCYERGLDIEAVHDTQSWGDVYEAVETTVSARDPLAVTVTVELEGDRLAVTLDEDGDVVDIEETTGIA